MLQYICVVTNENESIKDHFIHSVSFHTSFSDANDYGNDVIKTLTGKSDFYIYRNIGAVEDDFLDENEDELLPFN